MHHYLEYPNPWTINSNTEEEEKMNLCADINCGYYWQDEGEDYPSCHFDGFGKAPCEEDDWDE